MPKNEIISSILNQQITEIPFYITQISLDFYQIYWIQRDDVFKDYQIAICTGGSGIFECGGTKYNINEQDAFLFAPYIPHSYHPVGEAPWTLDWVCYNGQKIEPLYRDGYRVLHQIKLPKTVSGMRQMYSLVGRNDIKSHIEASQILYSVLMELVAHQHGFYQNNRLMQRLSPAITYMEQQFNRDLSLEELAGEIGISVSYLCRLFQSVYQMSPLQYLIRLRINHAKQLILTYPQLTIKEISLRCGYKDATYFGAEFKRNTGLSPIAYRSRSPKHTYDFS